MAFLLDSDAWIVWLRQSHPGMTARIQQEPPSNLFLCAVVVGELIFGAERSGAAHRASNLLKVTQLRSQCVSLPLANGLTLVTHNTAEFSRVPGLLIEDWQIP